jgi:arylsulfatase A-like enzyme
MTARLTSTVCSICCIVAVGPFFSTAWAAQPNVLFIAVDDLNDWIEHLGGHPNAKTPNIDRLAKRGVSFTAAYCSAPLCNPSRISLLTGIAPSNSGVYGNGEQLRDKLPDAVTLMQHFRNAGYTPRGSGKIFHGAKPYDPNSWDEFHVPEWGGRGKTLPRDATLSESAWTPWGPSSSTDEEMFDHKVASWVISELDRTHDKPFFLAGGFTKPHLPWIVPKAYFDRHPLEGIELPETIEGDLDDVPPFGRKLAREVYDVSGGRNFEKHGGDHQNVIANDQWRIAVQAYLATISFVDDQVGRVLDALDQSDYADNTIIVLWGDHGWHLGEKEHWRKHALWDVTTRTPLIISAPEMVAKNKRCDRPVSLIDLYPTLIDLCELPKRDDLDGLSLAPLLANPAKEWTRPAVMTYGYKNHAVQTDRWRYIQYHDGTNELYDHDNDPNEWMNLAENPEYDTVIRELKASLPTTNAKP